MIALYINMFMSLNEWFWTRFVTLITFLYNQYNILWTVSSSMENQVDFMIATTANGKLDKQRQKPTPRQFVTTILVFLISFKVQLISKIKTKYLLNTIKLCK